MSETGENEAGRSNLREIVALFFRLGVVAFGGPAAHVAMMHDEVVVRRKWLSEERFLDLLGATSLIPGPNSTEMTIHLGYLRGGWRGLIAAGVSFITPAMFMVMGLAALYVQFGSLPQAEWLLYGVKPVVIAIIVQALWGLGQKAVTGPTTAVVGVIVMALYFLGINILVLLLGAGLFMMLARNADALRGSGGLAALLPIGLVSLPTIAATGAVAFSLPLLFFTFLKIGSVLYGSGYVLLAFLRDDFVVNLGWLTDQQIIDAVAIGQVTPGPVFTTATFIGYVLGGVPGGILATVGIFLPAFVFVALSNPIIPRLRESRWFGGLLDGVNVASLGLMAAVTIELGAVALIDPITIALALISAVALFRFKVNTTWLIGGAIAVGLAAGALGWV